MSFKKNKVNHSLTLLTLTTYSFVEYPPNHKLYLNYKNPTMKNTALLFKIALIFVILQENNVFAQIPDYYNSINVNQKGEELKNDLSVLISSTHTTFLSYTPGVWNALKQADLDPIDKNKVLLIYGYNDNDNTSINDRSRSKEDNGGNTGDWNREHTFPKSLGKPNLGTKGAGADAHHLRASDVKMNSNRQSTPFADGAGNAGNVSNGWYPGDEWKGDIARMMMYMYLRYGNQCSPEDVGTGKKTYHNEMMDIFLEWNAEDPVSMHEINRNIIISNIQGNRNPFIDNPAFATSIWGGPQAENRFNSNNGDNEAPSTPTSLSVQNITQTTADLSWTASSDNTGVIAYQIFSNSKQITATSKTNFTVTNLTPNTRYTFFIRAIDAFGNASSNSIEVNLTTLEEVNPPAESAIVFQGFEKTLNDTWKYVNSPVKCTNGSDIWDIVKNVGYINSANSDNHFFGVRDLDGNCGSADGGTIIFENVDISNYTDVSLSFAINVVGYDVSNGDSIIYEIFHDNKSQGIVPVTLGNTYNTNGWITIKKTIPNAVKSVNFAISVKQNGGSDYAGFDDIQLQGNEIKSTSNIIINEVDADTPGTDTQEFVELYDGGTGNTSLNGFVLVFYNGSNNQSYAAYDLDGQKTNNEGYFVIGNAGVPNVSSLTFNNNGLQNGADAVALYLGDATDYPNNSTISTENLIDAFVYDTNDADDVELKKLLNKDQPQVNENGAGNKNIHSSQRFENGSGGARNTESYVQAIPTPGKKNELEPQATEAIPIVEARTKSDGETVTVAGTLTVSDQFSGSAYLQDDTGGIAIFDKQVYGDGMFMIGDSIRVTGIRSSFNNQIQISSVTEVIKNGKSSISIKPKTITLSQLSSHPGELVRIKNPKFPDPGNIFFGNSNYTLTDKSGRADIRIDMDDNSIVGLGQPQSCNEIVGVISRFRDTYQILPRNRKDIACANNYEVPDIFIEVDKSKALDIATWNIEWFGDESNSPSAGSPNSDAIQKDSVKKVIQALNADIIAVQEIVDIPLFTEMINELPDYKFILSTATSYPNDSKEPKQHLGFIYNKNTVSVKDSKVLLESIHPYYNGGDESTLVNYPSNDKTRFYASGRLPFMITANITIDGNTKEFNLVNIHARANSRKDAQNRYDMRRYDIQILKDSLDTSYADKNIVLLGDYNDDVDETVTDVKPTISTYNSFIEDSENYIIVSSSLSDLGFRSYVSRDNMIDHIMLSNELNEEYITTSERVHYEFYNANYTNTVSDHFPVSTQLLIKSLMIDKVITAGVSCNGNQDGKATVSISGGCAPYTYKWSNGALTEENTISELIAGNYSVEVKDALGNTVTTSFKISENEPLSAVISDDKTIYYGYETSYTTINVSEVKGGHPPYRYRWNNGAITTSNIIQPSKTTTYSVEITDAKGCSINISTTVKVIDVRCGKKLNRVEMCFRGKSICVPKYFVNFYLHYGATLGSCNTNDFYFTQFRVFPNPFARNSYVKIKGSTNKTIELIVYNCIGKQVFKEKVNLISNKANATLKLSHLRRGLYYLQAIVDGKVKKRRTLYKYR